MDCINHTPMHLLVFILCLSCFPFSSFCHWLPASATWYGSPKGDGSNGGACGYGSLVNVKPFRARVSAVSPILYKKGEGCGACYKIKCTNPQLCSKRPATVVVTDECPNGGYCAGNNVHFDLSGGAVGHMAHVGRSNSLRNTGVISILYRRVPCKYRGKKIAFHVDGGSSPYFLSLLVEYESGDGDIGSLQIRPANSNGWLDMNHIWGATWSISQGPLEGPFSLRLTTLTTKQTLTARNIIPSNWAPNTTYTSNNNFFWRLNKI